MLKLHHQEFRSIISKYGLDKGRKAEEISSYLTDARTKEKVAQVQVTVANFGSLTHSRFHLKSLANSLGCQVTRRLPFCLLFILVYDSKKMCLTAHRRTFPQASLRTPKGSTCFSILRDFYNECPQHSLLQSVETYSAC